ncbi:SGNH/GDSL hydrolase family protein [Methylomonas sp. 11b]|uniref:SGNH/GDSL hydrolase family protein n=1 Tax=Methylomonas sp. 11b TaxID=1168169 RepID=UPI000479CBAA|nr:SGNH/GDSL hydrolase family protein [Methylomonas sp. 11b]
MTKKPYSIALFFASLLASSQVGATPFSNLFVFGDSLSDSGSSASSVLSAYNLGGKCDSDHPCPPYYQGRISNGPTAAEYIANSALSGGGNAGNFFNFAVAGSTTGIGNEGDGGSQTSQGSLLAPGMAQQFGLFSAQFTAAVTPDSLFFVWGGANDFLTGNSATAAAANIANYVGALIGYGAQHIVVPNLPDLSITPFAQSLPSNVLMAAQNYSLTFNQELTNRLDALSLLSPNTQIVEFDAYNFFTAVIQNPTAYGFTNSTEACVSLPDVCSDPASRVFWDDFHPTTQVHALFAGAVVSQVPLPGSIVFLVSGLMGLLFAKRRPA